jgi:hypothetical protein
MTIPALHPIAVVDVREAGALGHAEIGRERALALRDDCLKFFPGIVAPMLPAIDRLARRWLRRSRSPYVAEIEAIAAALAFPGIWFLNGSYQWGCTTLVRDEEGAPWLARTLDWPFPGLGRHVEVAQMRGPAGEFYSVTWPGYVGALTGMAPGRFAAAINQAPLWRRTRHPWLRIYDIVANAVRTWRHVRHIPPDQLLRQAFETCRDFAHARRLLEQTPVARPVIFTLAGAVPGERCVIERTEDGFTTHEDLTCAANDWLRAAEPWEGRVASDLLLNCSYAEAGENSRRRREALHGWSESISTANFSWVHPPVLNPCTRIAVEACAANGTLRVVGYENVPGHDLPQPVTQVCELRTLRVAA